MEKFIKALRDAEKVLQEAWDFLLKHQNKRASEQLGGMDISEVSVHLRNFSKNVNLDTEFLKRKKT